MLRIELSALSAQELKRLLDNARARGQTALVEQLVAELAMRPSHAAEWTPAHAGYGAQAAFEPADDEPRSRRSGVMATTAALAALVSAAVTWGLSVPISAETGDVAEVAAPPRVAVVRASLAPVGPQPLASLPEPAPAPAEAQPARVQLARAAPTPARAAGNPCFARPTAAERLVCGYPTLAAQDRQLRAAYDRALASGVDRRELDRAQAIWRGEIESVADRKLLAERYQRRIREIEAAPARPAPPPREDPPF